MGTKVPQAFKDKICQMPESGYGTNRVRVLLQDGSRFSAVVVAWGEDVVKVGATTTVPFNAEDIVEVENDL